MSKSETKMSNVLLTKLSVKAENQLRPILYNARWCTQIHTNQLMQKGTMNCLERKGDNANALVL